GAFAWNLNAKLRARAVSSNVPHAAVVMIQGFHQRGRVTGSEKCAQVPIGNPEMVIGTPLPELFNRFWSFVRAGNLFRLVESFGGQGCDHPSCRQAKIAVSPHEPARLFVKESDVVEEFQRFLQ